MTGFLYIPVMASMVKRSVTGDLHLADIPSNLVFTASAICNGLELDFFSLVHLSNNFEGSRGKTPI
jgi:hypothetical protein